MKLYSTNDKNNIVDLKEAVLHSLPKDKGLYMPTAIKKLDDEFINNLHKYSFQEIAFKVAENLIGETIPKEDLKNIVEDSINFIAPVVTIEDKTHILELFHGPTLAFKDFGARFMARLMQYFLKDSNEKIKILVATSGDTGGAVAAGFYNIENIEVVILYPKGRVSKLQEKQLTTWGGNIKALEIDGNFDQCQALVKQAFLDPELNEKCNLSSANSINIARLIPQSFYYFEAYKQLTTDLPISFVVPSGNFGNMTAGLLAKKMGLPISKFIAATNKNDVFPKYLASGEYNPIQAYETLSNAMDIGNPSNFYRILDLYGSTWNNIKEEILGYSISDEETVETIVEVHNKLGYVLDPHTAVGYLGSKNYNHENEEKIILSTAHPIKFANEVADSINFSIPHPSSINTILKKEGHKTKLSSDFKALKDFILQ
ncbi:threonine synthase [Membranihabitans marinus]|uniref:threonine synthase n=1 Tax=Membranihabitans marinus TaxID=1227546 RepID=UPI001F017203|nr:threonine synthase [Membranihabitans marinus]